MSCLSAAIFVQAGPALDISSAVSRDPIDPPAGGGLDRGKAS